MFHYFFPSWIQVALLICKPGQVSSPLKLLQVLWINVDPALTRIQRQQLFLTFAVMCGNIIYTLNYQLQGKQFCFPENLSLEHSLYLKEAFQLEENLLCVMG